ncbi:hypothetical protein CDFC105_64103 [Clostridioides difficile]|nr:hypothetical protein CDFC105_64103 [Clostridioides difficile]
MPSLVGSEMCIRDRYLNNRANLMSLWDVQDRLRHPDDLNMPYGFKKKELITCLLYTSDAADDMQCVDLGGRRIIKKKKNAHSRVGRIYSKIDDK